MATLSTTPTAGFDQFVRAWRERSFVEFLGNPWWAAMAVGAKLDLDAAGFAWRPEEFWGFAGLTLAFTYSFYLLDVFEDCADVPELDEVRQSEPGRRIQEESQAERSRAA
jgi:hypothetical protein